MSDTTPRAALPLLAAAQAQKHVTHNEALLQLDALAFARFLDRDLTAPPASPADGDTYLIHAAATGDWTGKDGQIAYCVDGAWRFAAPFAGLAAYVVDEARLVVFTGAAWVDYASILNLQNVPLLGVNTIADATNKLAVKSAALLFDNVGNGVQAKLNKTASGDTASVLYQAGYAGHAEIGLCGDNDLHFKVSPDGASWSDALKLAAASGQAQLLAGSAAAPALAIGSVNDGWYRPASHALGLSLNGTEVARATATALSFGANSATNPALNVDASAASSATGFNLKSAAAGGGAALSVLSSGMNESLTLDAKGSGTITLGGTSTGAIVHARVTTFSAAITYGGVTLSNAVTGTGAMALATAPSFTTPTLGVASATSLAVTGGSAPMVGLWSSAANTLNFAVNGSDSARLDANGNLLVGTSASLARLTGMGLVSGDFAAAHIGNAHATDGDSVSLNFSAYAGNAVSAKISHIRNFGSGGDLIFSAWNGALAEAMRINGAGPYLLVGYTASQGAYKLQVNSQIFATNATIATSDLTRKRVLAARVPFAFEGAVVDRGFDPAFLAAVLDVPEIMYTRRDETNSPTQFGYGAQHWQAVLARIDPADGNGWRAVQRLADGSLGLTDSDAHTLKIAALTWRCSELEARLARLEAPPP